MYDKLTTKTKEILEKSQQRVLLANQASVEEEHIFLALLEDEDTSCQSLVQLAGGNVSAIIQALNEQIKKLPITQQQNGEITVGREMQRLFNLAYKYAHEVGDAYIAADTLFLILAKEGKKISKLLRAHSLLIKKLEEGLKKNRQGKKVDSANAESTYNILEKYTVNLSEQARLGKLDPVIGRDEEIRRAVHILQRRTKNNPVLIGEPGVGKTAIAEGLAQRFINGEAPEEIANKEIIVLDISALLAGAKYRGEFEERLKMVLKAIMDNANYIVFIDELHTLVGAGRSGEGAIDAANMLKPMLARGELHCIGATTLDEYRQYIEKDSALERRFQKVLITEPSHESAIAILRGLSGRYEAHHGVRITDSAIVAAVELSSRYITDRFLPDKAIDLIDEAAARLKIEASSRPESLDRLYRRLVQLRIEKEVLVRESDKEAKKRLQAINTEIKTFEKEFSNLDEIWQRERNKVREAGNLQSEHERLENEMATAERASDWQRVAQIRHGELKEIEKLIEKQKKSSFSLIKSAIGANEIAEVVAMTTGIPIANLVEDEKTKLQNIEKYLEQSVVGQSHAVTAIANTIRRARTGLSDENKPLGTFLFLGPTGVGKTQLCKTLAAFLFDTEKHLTRIDMSEYMEIHSVARLIGAPPGYVGFDEGGQLTESVRRQPFSVLLLDEIEKAHPSILNVLLQVLDEGRMTDGRGKTVDFKNTIIIMTSNLAAEKIQLLAADLQSHYAEIIEAVRGNFRPEFFNRIDESIIFNPLSSDNLHGIVEIHLSHLYKRLAKRHWQLEIHPTIKKAVATDGFVPELGARPLKRLLQTRIENPLAEWILANEPAQGEKIIMDAKGKFNFAH